MPAVGYIVEDVVFYLWLIILIAVVARNTHFEFKYLKNEKRTIVRVLNRCNAFVLLFLVCLAPDWSSYKGLIPRNGLYQAIFYGLVICVQFIEFFLYIFLTTRALIFAKKTALAGSQPFERTLALLKNTFIIATTLLFVVDALRMALYYTYNEQYYHGLWLLYVGTCALISCIVFFFVCSRLKTMLAHLKYGEFSGIRSKLTKLQWLSGPICLAIFAATMWVGIGEMNSKPQPIPDSESYSFRYSLFAWGHLIYASAFAYVAWQPMSSLRGRPSISVPQRQNSRRSGNGYPPVPGLHPQGSHSFLPSIPDKENTGGTDDSSSGGMFSASPKQILEEGPSPPPNGASSYSKGTFASLPPYHHQPRPIQQVELQHPLQQANDSLKGFLPQTISNANAYASTSSGLSPADSLSPPLSARSHYTPNPITSQPYNQAGRVSVTTLDTSTLNGESRAPSSTVLSCDTDFSSGTLRNESRTITITKLATYYDTERGGTSAGWL